MMKFTTTVSYSESGEQSHSATAIHNKCVALARTTGMVKPFLKKPGKLKGKEKKGYKKRLEQNNFSANMQRGKMIYSCKRIDFTKDATQGLIINKMIKNQTHLLSTMSPNFHRQTFFFSDKVEVIVLKDVLSDAAMKGQSFLFQLHDMAPLNIKPQCKTGALPMANHICRGAKNAEARAFLGTNYCDEFEAIITGRSCSLFYKNKEGKRIHHRIENPCSRTTYGNGKTSGKDVMESIQVEWERQDMEQSYTEVESFIQQYYNEVKDLCMEFLPYFFEEKLNESQKEELVNAFFDERMQLTTNLVNLLHLSGAHVDTTPKTGDFPSIITLQNDRLLDGEGELAFPGLGFRIQYQNGDVVFMRPLLLHGICAMNTDIDRYSTVFYNNKTLFTLN